MAQETDVGLSHAAKVLANAPAQFVARHTIVALARSPPAVFKPGMKILGEY
jgi:hypothetical protein